jgi:transposase
MPYKTLTRFLFLPELEITAIFSTGRWSGYYRAHKTSKFEVCPKCASPSSSIYDHRTVTIRDEPIRRKAVFLLIKKRRFFCKTCKKPFTEPISGITKQHRTTHRFKRGLQWACEHFTDLNKVREAYKCAKSTLYKAHYEILRQKQKTRSYPLPKQLGIDEHSIRKPKYKSTEYSTIVVDHKNRRVYELFEGRNKEAIDDAFKNMKGKENVQVVTMDMSSTYRSAMRRHLPNATIVADRFHVQRMMNRLVNKKRKELTGDKRTHPIRTILLRDNSKLDWEIRRRLLRWLNEEQCRSLKEAYEFKEAISRLYRMKGYDRAKTVWCKLMDRMGKTKDHEVKGVRATLLNWGREILAYFRFRLTNGRVEGFNRKAKLLQRRAYGYSNFQNYRLRLLNECSGREFRGVPTTKR